MKREVPLLITFLVGILVIVQYFFPAVAITTAKETFLSWTEIITAFAIFLGIVSIVQVHGQKISQQSSGWLYSGLLLLSMLVTVVLGLTFGTGTNISPRPLFVKRQPLVVLADGKTGQTVRTVQGHLGDIQTAALCPANRELCTADTRGQLLVSQRDGQIALAVQYRDVNIRALAYSPDGKYLAAAGELLGEQTTAWLMVWNRETKTWSDWNTPQEATPQEPPKTWQWVEPTCHTSPVTALAFSPDGKFLVSGDLRAQILVWDVAQGKKIKYLEGYVGPVVALHFVRLATPEPSQTAIVCGDSDGMLTAWAWESWQTLHSWQVSDKGMTACAIADNGTALIVPPGKIIEVGDVSRQEKLGILQRTLTAEETGPLAESHLGPVKAIALSASGQWAVSVASDNVVRLWDVVNRKELQRWQRNQPTCAQLLTTSDAAPEIVMGYRVALWANPFDFIFQYFLTPLSNTMFALLAFFMASAAFRAFRARSKEATCLLVAAFLVMLGRVPLGEAIWPYFKDIADWIMDVPNNAAQRAIMIGAALGMISAGLRILIGLEQDSLKG